MTDLQSCRVAELESCRDTCILHSLELLSCIMTESKSLGVAEASQGIANWGPVVSFLGNRGVGW